jgi:hypothetical protein
MLWLWRPISASVACDVHRKFQPAPHAKLVKCAAQMVLDYLFAGANYLADFAIGQTLPH